MAISTDKVMIHIIFKPATEFAHVCYLKSHKYMSNTSKCLEFIWLIYVFTFSVTKSHLIARFVYLRSKR